MFLQYVKAFLACVFLMVTGCRVPYDESWDVADGAGGNSSGKPSLTLPFPSGEYWQVTRTYNDSTHTDYGGSYSDDRYAVDFAQSSCEGYGKPVNPMADGEVYDIDYDSGDGTGYGNTVIIEHDNGYFSRYAHLSDVIVSDGDELSTSDYLGRVGNTGNVSGTACGEYPGTHLHVALYKDDDGVKPEPLSGNWDLEVGCWYNREGDKNCSGNPGEYDDEEEIDDEGELNVAYLAVNPEEGTADETEFIWTAIVVSPDLTPEATLWIRNPNDSVNYEFEMETESETSPYVFSYRKTLRDAATYSYWVKATNGDGNDTSDIQEIIVEEDSNSMLEVTDIKVTPDEGVADETEFEWTAEVSSGSRPEVTLYVVNPNDATTYMFDMTVSSTSETTWIGSYDKSLRDATTYTYWAVADNGSSTATSEVKTIIVSDGEDGDGSGGGTEVDTGEEEDTGEVEEEVDSGSIDTGTETSSCDVNVPADYSSIQEAVNASADGSNICVESGTYYENLLFDGVSVTVVSVDGAASTVIDGGSTDSTVSFTNGAAATLDGFTIQNGSSDMGGGIYIDDASPTIQHCKITGNSYYGIGVWNSGSAATVKNSIIVNNDKRGVYATNYSSLEMFNVVVASNGTSGIGSYAYANVDVVSSIIYANGQYGVYAESTATMNLAYNDVYGNVSGDYSGNTSAASTDISSDPDFSETAWYTLDSASVCEDAGDPSSSSDDTNGTRNDMGAYGGPLGSW